MSNDDGSFLKSALIAAPTVAGAGIGVRGLIRTGVQMPRPSSVSKAMATLQKIEQGRPKISMDDHLRFMNQNAGYMTGQGSSVTRQAWRQAYQSADPLAREHLKGFAASLDALSDAEVYSAIQNNMKTQHSDFAHSIYRKFRRNIGALRNQERVAEGLGALTYNPVTAIFEKPGFRSLADQPNMLASISRIEEGLGMLPNSTSTAWYSRPGWQERNLGSYSMRFQTKGLDINLMVPLAEEGVMVSGATQQTKYIAPQAWIVDKETGGITKLKRHEYFMSEFERSVLPDIKSGKISTQFEVNRAIKQLQVRTIQQLETLPNVRPELETNALRMYQTVRSQQAEILMKEGDVLRRATEDELADVMRREGQIFAGTSPTAMAGGRLSTKDLSQLAMVPEATNWGRRPEQGFRQYQLTENARRAMFEDPALARYQRYRRYESEAMRGIEEVMTRPHLKTMYVDPKMHSALLAGINIGEGEALGRGGLGNLLEFEAIRTKHLTNVREDLIDPILKGQVPDLKPGEIIGFDEAGVPVKAEKNMRLLQGSMHRTQGRGEYMSLHYMDTRRLMSNDKVFEDMKALMRLTSDQRFKSISKKFSLNEQMIRNLDVIANMDELRKDTRKHTTQIISALGEVIEGRAGVLGGAAAGYMKNPEQMVQAWTKEVMGKGDVYDHEKWIRRAMKFAVSEIDVTPQEFGAVFGAVPTVLGDTQQATRTALAAGASKRQLREMFTGLAGGVAKVAYAEPAWRTGAGAMGSLEPRAFDILRGGALGEMGEELTSDFMRRLAYQNPEKLEVHRALAHTLQTMSGEQKAPLGARVWQADRGYDAKKFQQWIEQGGGWLSPGKGMRDINVPGAATLEAMRPFETAGGQRIKGPISDIFHGLAESGSLLHAEAGRISSEEYLRRVEGAAGDIGRQWAPAGKGAGAVTRGKLIGTRFLRGVSESGGYSSKNPFVAGITNKYFEEMFAEMATSGMYNKERLGEMGRRFRAGEEIGGMVARHPFIGEFSLQPMRFQQITGSSRAEIVMPELLANIQGKELRLGPLVGMAGDKDADIFSAMLLSPDLEHKAAKMTRETGQYVNRYTQHQVRYQLLKAKSAAGAGEMSLREIMIADMRKLGTTERWVPQLSLELSSAKRALAQHGQGRAAADARMLLEWLEQTPISSKHLSPQQLKAGGLESLMGEITSSLQVRGKTGEQRLTGVVEGIIERDGVAERLLKGNIQMTGQEADNLSKIMGRPVSRDIQGANVQSAVKELMSSLDLHQASGGDRTAEVLGGRGGRLKVGEIGGIVARSTASISQSAKGTFSQVAAAVTTASNMAGAAGRGVLKHHKPLAMGLAGSLAIATALSSPRDTIGPGSGLTNVRMKMNLSKAADRMKPETMHPPQQQMGDPTVPAMMAGRRALVTSRSPSQQVHVKARANYMVNTPNLAGRIAGVTGGRSSVNLRDNRSSLNKHIIANKLL